MLKVRVKDFRVAAKQLIRKDEYITVTGLARMMNREEGYVTSILLSMPWLKAELGVIVLKSDYVRVYTVAAKRLREKSIPVTLGSIADHLHKEAKHIQAFLRKHPEVRLLLNLEPESARRKKSVVLRYAQRVSLISGSDAAPVKISAYCKEYGVDRSTVNKDIKKYPEISPLFIWKPRKPVSKTPVLLAAE